VYSFADFPGMTFQSPWYFQIDLAKLIVLDGSIKLFDMMSGITTVITAGDEVEVTLNGHLIDTVGNNTSLWAIAFAKDKKNQGIEFGGS